MDVDWQKPIKLFDKHNPHVPITFYYRGVVVKEGYKRDNINKYKLSDVKCFFDNTRSEVWLESNILISAMLSKVEPTSIYNEEEREKNKRLLLLQQNLEEVVTSKKTSQK